MAMPLPSAPLPPLEMPSGNPAHDIRNAPTKGHFLSNVSWLCSGFALLAGIMATGWHFAPEIGPHMVVILWAATLIAGGFALLFGILAKFARDEEREKANAAIGAFVREKDAEIAARVREAVDAVDMVPAVQRGRDEERREANLEIEAARTFREAEMSSLRERLSQVKKSCDGWEKDYKRLQDTNLALSASVEKLQQATRGGPSPSLEQVQKLRRARTEFQKNVISDYIATIERLRGEPTWVENRSDDDPEWTHWMRRERILLWQAVCLSFNSNPDKVSVPSEGPAAIRLTATNYHHLTPGRDHYKERLREAEEHFGIPLDGSVNLAEFAQWALEEWEGLPEQFDVLSRSIPPAAEEE